MLQIISLTIIILQVALSFKKPLYGVLVLLVAHNILPPFARIGSVSLNTAMIFISFLFVASHLVKRNMIWNKDIWLPLPRLIIPLLLIGLFASMPLSTQVHDLAQFFITGVLIFSLVYAACESSKDIRLLVYAYGISFAIIAVYGIFTYIIKSNPLVLLYTATYGYEGEVYVESDGMRGALLGSATGNMDGPLAWGQVCAIMLPLFIVFREYWNNKIKWICIALLALNCVLCTKRSAILPMVIAVCYAMFVVGNVSIKKTFVGLASSCLFLIVLFQIPAVQKVYDTNIKTSIFFWDDKLNTQKGGGGSDKSMRLEQFIAVNKQIADCPFQGKGQGFTSQYTSKFNNFTAVRAYESIVLSALANSGYIGLVVWAVFFALLFRKTKGIGESKYDNALLHGVFLLNILLTGINAAATFQYLVLIAIAIRMLRLKGRQRTLAL